MLTVGKQMNFVRRLLPLDQFMFAELLTSGEKEQKLRLAFATHEIVVFGHVLRRIETVMQHMELSGLMKLPEKYHALLAGNQSPKTEALLTSKTLVALFATEGKRNKENTTAKTALLQKMKTPKTTVFIDVFGRFATIK